jgi:hypothetical protein
MRVPLPLNNSTKLSMSMIPSCVYLSEEPYLTDILKVPEVRYVCRCFERNKVSTSPTFRYVGNSTQDCDVCKYYKHFE